MKTIVTIFIAVFVLTINGYSQNTTVKTLLDKQETRTEIFNAIMGDHQLMSEFMTAMKGNKHATMMMQNSNTGMHGSEEKHSMKESSPNHKMQHGDMMGMMKSNPEMMKKMMTVCMNDSAMRCSMVDMMMEQPEMMKSIKSKMKETEKTGLDKMH